MSTAFPHLLSPLRIGPKTVHNRVLVTAHVPGLAENHLPSDRWVAYHRARARGGAGLQLTGATPVHRSGGLEFAVLHTELRRRHHPGLPQARRGGA